MSCGRGRGSSRRRGSIVDGDLVDSDVSRWHRRVVCCHSSSGRRETRFKTACGVHISQSVIEVQVRDS